MVRLSVAQLLPALNGGGVERGTLEVARELVQHGHRSLVISAGGRLAPELACEGSEHLAWPLGVKSPLTLRWVWPLRRWLAEQRIDILHARSRLPAWVGWLAWRGMDPADPATFRHHSARFVFGFPLQRDHDSRRAGDRGFRNRARLLATPLSRTAG
jgi:hypothetical protein